ncbi:hypothetical protein [Cellulomonas sp. URHD0024]|uniref:hypothetical protein n=1 Tax=Cellulomonas sp. URHD0024 TaxID=1302620 RepID=UPI0004108665|nr:hypothetical protein [Cellulomonas sp. URHD0024]
MTTRAEIRWALLLLALGGFVVAVALSHGGHGVLLFSALAGMLLMLIAVVVAVRAVVLRNRR